MRRGLDAVLPLRENTWTGTPPVTNPKTLLLPALLAVGSGIGASPARALELGELLVDSTLGQPLRASIAYALAPNEQLAAYCVTVVPARDHGGVPAAGKAEVSAANGMLRLSGTAIMREPVVSLRLSIDCPYSPRLERHYTVFLDPALPHTEIEAAGPIVASERPAQSAAPVWRQPAPAAADTPAVAAVLPSGNPYRVQAGDSLSSIAARMENRRVSLWMAVRAMHAANPDAFVDNDPDRLKTGVSLFIPDAVAGEPVPAADTLAAIPGKPAPALPAAPDTRAAPAATPAGLAEVTDYFGSDAGTLATARPGDIIIDGRALPAGDSAVPAPNRVLVDQRLEHEATSPNRPVAAIVPAPLRTQPAGSSLWWMVGGGFLLLAGLAYTGLRSRPPAGPADADPLFGRAGDGDGSAFPVLDRLVADDYELDDDSPTAENFALDANLEIGTGFDTGSSELFLAEDFGFDTSADLDLELPDDSTPAEESPSTDVIQAPKIEESMVLEREILPDDGDYEMSVIMDATKVPDPSAVTERDLKAFIVENAETRTGQNTYTVDQEVDYQVLEQDYEADLTATQALTLEIEKATAELADRLDAAILLVAGTTGDADSRAPRARPFDPEAAAGNDDDAGDLDITASHASGDTTISQVKTARLRALPDEAGS